MKFKLYSALRFDICIKPKLITHFKYFYQILSVNTKINVFICRLIEKLFTTFKTPLNYEVSLLVNICKKHDKQY